MIRVALNRAIRDNFSVICPDARLGVTIRQPIGFVHQLTPSVLRALRSKRLIDLDGVVDLERGILKEKEKPVKEEPTPTVTPVEEASVSENIEGGEANGLQEEKVEKEEVVQPTAEPKPKRKAAAKK